MLSTDGGTIHFNVDCLETINISCTCVEQVEMIYVLRCSKRSFKMLALSK